MVMVGDCLIHRFVYTDAKNNEVFLARYEGDFHSKMAKMMGNSYNFMSSIDCAG